MQPGLPGPEQLPGVSRETAIELARTLADLYQDLERRLAEDIARRLRSGMESPQWATDKAAAAHQLSDWARALLRRLEADASREITYAVWSAYLTGGEQANLALAQLQDTALPAVEAAQQIQALLAARNLALAQQLAELSNVFPHLGAVQRLAAELTLQVVSTHTQILRWTDDAYRTAVAAGNIDALLGVKTRRQATQSALDRLLANGVTGFVDRAGRRWNLASYVEMATRTGVAHAAVQGHLDRLGMAGRDLVIVSNAPQECLLCRPWEGKVLSINNFSRGRTHVEHATVDGRMVSVDVAGSVSQALAAGLLHPNCRHSLSIYLPGVTRIPTDTADPEGDAARQKLRYLERGVRSWKLREAGALDDDAARHARGKVREWQAAIREHVAATEHLGINRLRVREQINLGHF